MIEFRSLRYFVALGRRLHYTAAAEEVGISQSALSRSIQILERQLGMRLFDRDRGGSVFLTAQGRFALEQATALLDNADNVEKQLLLTAHGDAGPVRVGIAPLPARALLSRVLTEQLSTAPNVANEIVVRNAEALWPLLEAGDIEFFIAGDSPVPNDLSVHTEVLGYFPLNLIVRHDHPLLTRKTDNVDFPVVKTSRAGEAGELLAAFGLQSTGVVHIIEDYDAVVSMTASTEAIWITSVLAVAMELEKGSLCELVCGKPKPAKSFKIVAYSMRRRSQSPTAYSLMQTFRRMIKELQNKE